MKPRILLTVVLVICLSLVIGNAQTKNDCSSKSASEKSSCCMKGAKMTMASDAKSATNAQPTVIQASYSADDTKSAHSAKDSKECVGKSASQCTDADKAHCAMMKASLTKASTKACCKAKGTEAKADVKKGAQEKSAEAKGTN